MATIELPDVPNTAFILNNSELKDRLVKLLTYIIDDDIDLLVIEQFIYAMNWNETVHDFCKASANFIHEVVGKEMQHEQ